MKSTKNILTMIMIAGLPAVFNAQIYTPSGIIQGSSGSTTKVGVGTSAPATMLHVKTNVLNDGIRIEQSGTNNSSGAAQLGLYNTLTGGHSWALLSTSTSNSQGGGRLLFYDYSVPAGQANQATRMCIDDNGNVGIGTYHHGMAPSVKLHVNDGSLKFTGTDPVHGAPNIFWGGQPFPYLVPTLGPVTAPDGEWALEYNMGMKGLNFWRPNQSHLNNGTAQSTVNNILFLSNDNKVGVGTANPTALLTVNGKTLIGDPAVVTSMPSGYQLYVQDGILTEKLKVADHTDGTNWSDYVFDSTYHRNSLSYVEDFVKQNKHLPNVPSAQDVAKDGIDVAQMDAALLRQIEELWLHMIDLQKENEALKKELNAKH